MENQLAVKIGHENQMGFELRLQGEKYSVIYLDPPWKYAKRRKETKFGLGMHRYQGMTKNELCCLPVKSIAAENCALFMWHVAPKLVEYPIGELFDAWGFRYATKAFTWIKINKDGTPRQGPGNYTASNSEDCFLGIKGSMTGKLLQKLVPQVIMEPIQEHSRKPDIVRKRIERMFGDVARIELFARERTCGWSAWGNEV